MANPKELKECLDRALISIRADSYALEREEYSKYHTKLKALQESCSHVNTRTEYDYDNHQGTSYTLTICVACEKRLSKV